MPCYTMTNVTVDLSKAVKAGAGNVFAALQALGFQPAQQGDVIRFGNGEWINATTGEARLSSNRDVAEISRAVSKQVVLSQAKRFGWSVKEQKDGKLLVQKASF